MSENKKFLIGLLITLAILLLAVIILGYMLTKALNTAANEAVKGKYKQGAEYTITVLDGFTDTTFHFPDDQCGIDLKLMSRITPKDCTEGEDCTDQPASILQSNQGDVAIITDKKGNSFMNIPAEGGHWECVYKEKRNE